MPELLSSGISRTFILHDYKIKVRPRFFGNETADGMAKKIAEVLNGGGMAICVFDADVSTWNEEEKRKLDKLRVKYAKNKNVILCESLPAVEYWFLLHYENTNRFLGTSKAAMQALRKYMPDYDKTDSFLSNRRWVAEMSSDGKQDVACSRAKQFGNEGQSYSMIYKVFDAIK